MPYRATRAIAADGVEAEAGDPVDPTAMSDTAFEQLRALEAVEFHADEPEPMIAPPVVGPMDGIMTVVAQAILAGIDAEGNPVPPVDAPAAPPTSPPQGPPAVIASKPRAPRKPKPPKA